MAALAVAAAAAARAALVPAIGPTALPFVTFFPAVAWAGWYGGLGPSIVAVVLSLLTSDYLFFAPRYSFALSDPVALVAFPVAASFIVAAIELMHRARRELGGARDILSTTLASIGDAVLVADAAERVTFLNPEAERLTGWTSAEASGRPLAEVFRIVSEATRQPVENPAARVLRQGNVVGLANHTLLVARDGTETPIDDSAAPVRSGGDPVLGVVLVFRDVRAQRLAEVARARLASIVETSGDAIVSKDLTGTVLSWNAAAERLFGWGAAEMIGRSITAVIPPEHRDEEDLILGRIRSGRAAELIETTRITKDGRRIPVSVRVSPLADAEGTIVGASKIVRDLSDVVAARDALQHEKELLATTLSSIGDGVIATDADGRVTFLNPVAQALTGWNEADAAGRLLSDVFRIVNEDSRQAVENPALRAMREGVIVGLANHTILISRTDEEWPIDDSAAPIRDKRRDIVGSVLVFRDVTARRTADRKLRALELQLRSRIAELDETSRRKSEFLAILAHELRNPLAPIRNSITILQLKGPPDPDLVAARAVIERQVQQMSRLLDDLLDVNRLGRHKLQLRKERVSLASVVENAVEIVRPAISAAGHELTLSLPDEDVALHADPVRLAQVFANLLSNASKYTDPGGRVALEAHREGAQVVVSVTDTGIGIGPESFGDLFEMFAQAPGAAERAQGGLGIGLALAKGLVELHGGSISASSVGLGKGSVFTVRLPAADAAAAPSAPDQRVERSPVSRRILIADDVRDNTDTLAIMLRTLGHEVRTVYDGASAVAVAAEYRPEIVLLDIGMPGMSGYEVCRRIRAQPWGRGMYVIAQTGWGQDSDLRRAEEAGFDRHFLKPVDMAALADVLAAVPSAGPAS